MADRPDIEVILKFYGADDVPHSYNWRPMRCPFHGDRNASAQVNTDSGFYRCFTCDFFGDGFEVIKWREGIEFRDAVRFAEALAGNHDGAGGGEPSAGAGVPGKAWYQRGGRKGGPSGGRYTGTYSR